MNRLSRVLNQQRGFHALVRHRGLEYHPDLLLQMLHRIQQPTCGRHTKADPCPEHRFGRQNHLVNDAHCQLQYPKPQ